MKIISYTIYENYLSYHFRPIAKYYDKLIFKLPASIPTA